MIKLIKKWIQKRKQKRDFKAHMEWKQTKILPLP